MIKDENLEDAFIKTLFASNLYYNIEAYYDSAKQLDGSIITYQKASLIFEKSMLLDSILIMEKENLEEIKNFINTLPTNN